MRMRVTMIAMVLCAAMVVGVEAARAQGVHLQIDPQKSEVKAAVAEPLGRFRDEAEVDGTFQIISGDIDGDPNNPGQTGHVRLVIDATSYNSGNDHRDRTVLSHALDTADYQSITFESNRIEQVHIDAPGKMGNCVVVGNLTLHGTTRPISVPVNVSITQDGTLIADGQVTFHYTDYGVGVPRLAFAFAAGNEVTIEFHIVAEPVPAKS
jgi:polyisoprenoid-binding protein YceI